MQQIANFSTIDLQTDASRAEISEKLNTSISAHTHASLPFTPLLAHHDMTYFFTIPPADTVPYYLCSRIAPQHRGRAVISRIRLNGYIDGPRLFMMDQMPSPETY